MASPLLNYNANTPEEAAHYFRRRAFQMLADGVLWEGFCSPLVHRRETWGMMTMYSVPSFIGANRFCAYSIYVFAQHRGRGHMRRAMEEMANRPSRPRFITVPSCGVEDYLARYVPVLVKGRHTETAEYKAIEQYYGETCASRSGMPYMNHIDEGLGALYHLDADDITAKIFMLHPLIQVDEAMVEYAEILKDDEFNRTAVQGAWDYRETANSFLPKHREHRGFDDHQFIVLSSNARVNEALRADKIQNCKDFMLYLRGNYEEAWEENLVRYFGQWRKALEISDITAEAVTELITVPQPKLTGTISL